MIKSYATFLIDYILKHKNMFIIEIDKNNKIIDLTEAINLYLDAYFGQALNMDVLQVICDEGDTINQLYFEYNKDKSDVFKVISQEKNGNSLIILETPDDYSTVLSQMSQLNIEVLDLMRVVNKKNLQIQELVYKDVLTGLFNRRYVYELFNRIKDKSRKQIYKDVYLSMIDIDDFKKVNDTYGHEVGDRVLSELGAELLKIVEEDDCAARLGGDEFLIFFVNQPLENIYDRFEQVKLALDKVFKEEFDIVLTLSIGIVRYHDEDQLSFWLNKGDVALYEAKHKGKNRTVLLNLDEL